MTDNLKTAEKFNKLLDVMKTLRSPDGCPWDREQDYLSLRRYILEEAYELIEAIENEDVDNMTEECGDLLLQVVFISTIAEERKDFTICDVLQYITEKLIRRHPHVFGSVTVNNSEEVLRNWEKIKSGERKEKNKDESVIASVPRALPALLRSYRIQERAAKVGFDWPKDAVRQVMDKVDEEISELNEAVNSGNSNDINEELGDLLFAVTNLARHLKIDPEIALHKSADKFSKRFRIVEKNIRDNNDKWEEYSAEKLDKLWKKAKLIVKDE